MKPTFPILAAAACSSEEARLRRQDRWAGIATSSLRQPLRFRIRYRRKPIPGPQPLGRAPVNTGAIDITSPSALGVPGQQTFGAAEQSGIRHLRSERSPAQFGQLWVSNCPGRGVVGDGRQYPEHQRSAGFVGRVLEPIASCPLG
jgi:hypothetical protein